MLKSHAGTAKRRLTRHAGRALAAALGLLALGLGHALQPAASPAPPVAEGADTVMLYVQVEQEGAPKASPRMWGAMGQAMSVRWRPGAAEAQRAPPSQAQPWELQITTTAEAGQQLRLQARLRSGDPLQPLAAPTLVTPEGVPASFEVRSADGRHLFKVQLTARRAAKPELPGKAG